jgi:hypothetical protein
MKYLLSLFLLIGWAAARGQSGNYGWQPETTEQIKADVNKTIQQIHRIREENWLLKDSLSQRIGVLEKQVAYLVRRTNELEAEIKEIKSTIPVFQPHAPGDYINILDYQLIDWDKLDTTGGVMRSKEDTTKRENHLNTQK